MALIFLLCQESAHDVDTADDSRLQVPRWQGIQWHDTHNNHKKRSIIVYNSDITIWIRKWDRDTFSSLTQLWRKNVVIAWHTAPTHLSKLWQHWNTIPALQFKQIIHILGAFYLAKNAEVLKCQLNCHLNCIELKEVHLTLSYKFRCHFIWY